MSDLSIAVSSNTELFFFFFFFFFLTETQQITWRLGTPHPRSKQLLLRYANTLDVKEAGAAQRSQYYRKYGNPNLPQEMEWSRNRRKRKRPADLRCDAAECC